MENYEGNDFFNVGTGKEVSIKELSELIKEVVGYNRHLKFNTDKPDGTPRKLLDISRLKQAGWSYKAELNEGVQNTYRDHLNYIERNSKEEI